MDSPTPSMPRLPDDATGLRSGTLSSWFITLLVISAASPLSVVAGGFPIGMMLGNGAGTPALVVLALLLLLMFAAGYTAMGTCVTSAGGFYAMISRGVGGAAGGAAAFIAILGSLTLQFGLYGLLGEVVSESLRTQFDLSVPWWLVAVAAIASVAYFGFHQIDFSAKILACFVVAEYAFVLLLDVLILRRGGAHGIEFSSFQPAALSAGNPSIGILFCFAAFIGFEATTIYSEEAKDPKRSIPIATYSALILVGCFYSFSLWCLVIGTGAERVQETITGLSDPTNFLYLLSDTYAGQPLTLLLRGMFIVSIYAGLIAFHNSTARYFYSMGRERLLPRRLGCTHPQYKSPHVASLLQTVLCLVVVLLFAVFKADPVLHLFSWLSNIATVCLLLLMIATAAAVIVFFRRDAHSYSTFRIFWMPLAAMVGLCFVFALAVPNFQVLTGASQALSWALLALLPCAGFAGWAAALRLKSIDPVAYATLGHDRK
ncbi:APC family permease [Curvibacter gracilis]|uniref:APC family permease n=1 Tax=Curvibacter gracilis TaxID=230310 RepID=UPI0004AE456F|nr:APC family permease [Curvibacter gracilis]